MTEMWRASVLTIFPDMFPGPLGVSLAGKALATGSANSTIKLWEVTTGKETMTLKGHSGSVNGVALSADGRRAVSASFDSTLKVWDLETALLIATFTCDSAGLCCVFAGEKMIVAGDGAGRVHFLSLEERR